MNGKQVDLGVYPFSKHTLECTERVWHLPNLDWRLFLRNVCFFRHLKIENLRSRTTDRISCCNQPTRNSFSIHLSRVESGMTMHERQVN